MTSIGGNRDNSSNYENLFNTDLKTGGSKFHKEEQRVPGDIEGRDEIIKFKAFKIADSKESHKLHHVMSRILTPITALVERLIDNLNNESLQFTPNTSVTTSNNPQIGLRKQINEHVADYTNNLKEVSKLIGEKQKEIKKIEKQIAYGDSTLRQLETLGQGLSTNPQELSAQLQEAKKQLAAITKEWVQVRPNVEDLKLSLGSSPLSGSTLLVKLNRAERKIDQALLNQSVQEVNNYLNFEAVTDVRNLLNDMPEYNPQVELAATPWNKAIEESLKKIDKAEEAYKSVNGADNKTKPTPEPGNLKTADDVIRQKKHLVGQLKLYQFGIYQLKDKTQQGKYDSKVIKANMSYVGNVVNACLLQPPGDPFAKEVAKKVLADLKDIKANLSAEVAGSSNRPVNQEANQYLTEVNGWLTALNNDVINR